MQLFIITARESHRCKGYDGVSQDVDNLYPYCYMEDTQRKG